MCLNSYILQAMQENEDDDMNIDPNKDKELAEMLEGKNEHLYQRILYLVLADAAYFEGKILIVCCVSFTSHLVA